MSFYKLKKKKKTEKVSPCTLLFKVCTDVKVLDEDLVFVSAGGGFGGVLWFAVKLKDGVL